MEGNGMVERYLLSHPWLAPVLWLVLYTSDYYLTLWGARLVKRQDFYRWEGSYEMTPEYQDDVDKQRPVSRTLVTWAIVGAGLLLLFGIIPGSAPQVYGGFVGWFLLIEVLVHMRHFQNIMLYRRLTGPNPGVSGHILTTREGIYRSSSMNLVSIGIFVLLVSALTGSTLLLGGALHALYTSYHDLSLARYYAKTASEAASEESQPEDETADV
jgi:hypothetical protein